MISDDILDRKRDNDDEDDKEQLIFPINVHESLQASKGLKKSEKVGMLVSLWVIGCLVLAWFLMGWLRTIVPSGYVWITVGIELILQLTVGVYILRYAMDERAVFQEYSNENQSFSNYFKIYREIVSKEGSKYPFDVIEFDDGSYGVFLQCRLGHNTQARSESTYLANKAMIELLDKSGLPRKTYYHTEDFKTSEAAQDLRDLLSGIEDPTLFEVYRGVIQNYLRIATEESNVMCVTYLIYAPSRINKDDLLSVMRNVFTIMEKDDTVYRQVSVLKYDQIVEFLRHYYRLEVLDMGVIRAHIASQRKAFDCPVHVLKIYGKSGKIYSSKEFKKLDSEIIKDFGLQSAN